LNAESAYCIQSGLSIDFLLITSIGHSDQSVGWWSNLRFFAVSGAGLGLGLIWERFPSAYFPSIFTTDAM
jgi:hypothetical protein